MVNKKAAIELSMGTIVVIVLSTVMLIFGVVFVRTIMCGAIGLTGDINDKVKGEVNRMFNAGGGEIVCIGGQDPVTLIPGRTNIIYCSVRAEVPAKYKFEIKKITGTFSDQSRLEDYVTGSKLLEANIGSGNTNPQKILLLTLPEDAPNEFLSVTVDVSKNGLPLTTQQLSFEIKSSGLFKSVVC